MTSNHMPASLRRDHFLRLGLARDLGLRGLRRLSGPRHGAEAIEAVVLVDLGIEVAIKTALEAQGRQPPRDRFRDLLDALPEIATLKTDIGNLHDVRNRAQHSGIIPPDNSLPSLRATATSALELIFKAAGADWHRFSSVDQIRSDRLRAPLEVALQVAGNRPGDAAALAARAFARLKGWAAEVAGYALIPDHMWVFSSSLTGDMVLTASCEDNREEFIEAMIRLAAGASLGIAAPDLLRFQRTARGHEASTTTGGFEFQHEPDAVNVDSDTALWMVELVARSATKLEDEWPDLIIDGESP